MTEGWMDETNLLCEPHCEHLWRFDIWSFDCVSYYHTKSALATIVWQILPFWRIMINENLYLRHHYTNQRIVHTVTLYLFLLIIC